MYERPQVEGSGDKYRDPDAIAKNIGPTESFNMKIVIGFVGGSLDNAVIACDSEQKTPENAAVMDYYELSGNGGVGRRFNVPHQRGFQTYEVVRRLENGNNVIVRARHVIGELPHAELEEITVRC